jgi:hypothetical protein
MLKSNQIMQESSIKLKELGDLSRQDGLALRDLGESSQQDTRIIKFLTIIAMLYLPASLVAVRTYRYVASGVSNPHRRYTTPTWFRPLSCLNHEYEPGS